jgi:hypothetical protein
VISIIADPNPVGLLLLVEADGDAGAGAPVDGGAEGSAVFGAASGFLIASFTFFLMSPPSWASALDGAVSESEAARRRSAAIGLVIFGIP